MTTFIRSHLLAVTASAIVLLGAAAWLAFGYFGVHTLFVDDVVDEALPTFEASGAPEAPATDEAPSADATPAAPAISTPDDTAPDTSPPDTGEPDTGAPDTSPPDTTAAADEAGPMVEAAGTFESLGRYTTVGSALVLGDGSGQRFLRFEDFETSNGPDLEVYLVNSSTGDVSDFVSLGRLSGNIGNQNYEIPPDVDLTVYDTVMIWCVRFSSGFGQATLFA